MICDILLLFYQKKYFLQYTHANLSNLDETYNPITLVMQKTLYIPNLFDSFTISGYINKRYIFRR